MPSRPACVAILLFWVYAAGGLLRRDVLPGLLDDPAARPPVDRRWPRRTPGRPQWDLSVAEDAGATGASGRSAGP